MCLAFRVGGDNEKGQAEDQDASDASAVVMQQGLCQWSSEQPSASSWQLARQGLGKGSQSPPAPTRCSSSTFFFRLCIVLRQGGFVTGFVLQVESNVFLDE